MGSSKYLLSFVALVCVTLVAGHPQLFQQEEPEQPEQLELQEVSDDEPLTRTRRDNVAAGGGHHQQQQGWGWPEKKQQGWGWPEKKQQGWGWQAPKQQGWGWPSVGPVFTYVRTDGWSNFQWGVRHKVGGHKGWGSK